jgi:hypothetical protein
VRYTIGSGRDGGACCRRSPERSSREALRQMEVDTSTKPCRSPPRWPGKRGGGAAGVRKRGQHPHIEEENTAPCHSPSLPRPTERDKTTNKPLPRTTPPCYHGWPGEARRRSTPAPQTMPSAYWDGVGRLRHGWLHRRSLATAEETLRSGSGWSDPRSPPQTGIKPHYCMEQTTGT